VDDFGGTNKLQRKAAAIGSAAAFGKGGRYTKVCYKSTAGPQKHAQTQQKSVRFLRAGAGEWVGVDIAVAFF
jgi:hypothetical protein